MGLAHVDPQRAQQEIRSLLRGQWKNGMIPHIVYNPESSGYFPDPDFWQIPDDEIASQVQTSGITQPPLISYAVWNIYQHTIKKDNGHKFLSEVYPALLSSHCFLYGQRDPNSEGLVFIAHPWESGLDNSPRWFGILETIKTDATPAYKRLDKVHVSDDQRPSDREYDRFVYLIELFRQQRYQWNAIYDICPFLVQDVLFNSILQASNFSLLEIAKKLDRPLEEQKQISEWIAKTENAFHVKLWEEKEKCYYDFDLRKSSKIRQNTIAIFSTLFGRIPDRQRAQKLIETHLLSTEKYWSGESIKYLLTTVSQDNEYWNPCLYWKGPVWINTNWLVFKGLLNYEYEDLAEKIRLHSLQLAEQTGFYEYFDPTNGQGYGINQFSWSAALILDFLNY